jgi:hypothetical protein
MKAFASSSFFDLQNCQDQAHGYAENADHCSSDPILDDAGKAD